MKIQLGELIFIADLNELRDGNVLPISMDFTRNFGPRVLVSECAPLHVGQWVRIHCEDDRTTYWAEVCDVATPRDLLVAVDWDSGTIERTAVHEWSSPASAWDVWTTDRTHNTNQREATPV